MSTKKLASVYKTQLISTIVDPLNLSPTLPRVYKTQLISTIVDIPLRLTCVLACL